MHGQPPGGYPPQYQAPHSPPYPPQYAAPPGATPCSSCGRPVDPRSSSLSTATGLPICPMCVGAEGLQATQGRAAQSLAFGAVGSAALAWSLYFLTCGIVGIVFAVVAIVTGAQALNLLGKPDYQHTPNRALLQAAAIGGIVLAAMLGLFYVLSITILAAMHLVK